MRKTLLSILAGIVTAGAALANTVVMTIDLSTKDVTVADTISIRETVPVQIVNLGGSEAANLVLRILDNDGTVYAQETGFTDAGNDIAYGEISLNTQELVDYFEDMAMQAQMAFTLGLWDTSLNRLLINDVVTIQNNPYVPGMPGPDPVGVSYMVAATYDADTNGVVDTSDALVALLAAPPWTPSGTNDGVQAGVATNAGADTWVTFPVAYTGTVSVVATPTDDFTYEASIRVTEPVATTGFYFTVSSAAGTVTNAWKVFWMASPRSADSGGGGYTDARAVAAVSNVLGTAAWRDVGTDPTDLPTYADVEAIAGSTNSITNVTVASSIAGSSYTGSVTRTGRTAAITVPAVPYAWEGLYLSENYPSGPFGPVRLNIGITNSGVTSAKILDETITLADISNSAEATLVARAGNVYTASNQTYSAGTTQAFSTTTAGTSTVTRLDIAEPELCGDSQFLTPAGWTYDTNFWTLGFGALFYQGSGSATKSVSKSIGAIAGRMYTVTYEYYLEGVGVQFRANVGGTGGALRLASGTYTDTIVAGTNGLLSFSVSPLLGGEVYAWVSNVAVYDTNADIKMTNGVINVGGRTVTWDKIALWDAAGAGGGTSTNSTHLGGVAAASYATDAEVTAAVSNHNASLSAHTALFAAKQDAATAATDSELAAHTNSASAHAALFAAKQPLDADLTTLAANNGGSLTNLQPFRTAWRLAYGNGSKQWTEIGLGASGQYLRSAGPSAAPSWYTPSFSAIATNMGIADLTNTFAVNEFVVGDGTNLVQTSLAATKTLLGVGTSTGVEDLTNAVTANAFIVATNGTNFAVVTLAEAQSILGVGASTNVQFQYWTDSGTSNDIPVCLGGTTWTNDAFLDVLNTVVAAAGGWYAFNLDAQTIDGLDSAAFLQTTASIDALADVETNGVTSGDTLIWDGAKFAPGTLATDTNALEALWQADDATLSNALVSAYGAADTVVSNGVTAAYEAADTVVSNAVVAGYGAADTALSNALISAFYTGYTNVTLAREAGDTAVSNYVDTTVAGYVKKDGTVAMTGNLNMGGHSITNIAAASLGFVGGATISAAKVAAWDAVGTSTLATVASTYTAKAGDLTQFTALGGTSGQVFKSNGAGGGAWSSDNTGTSFSTMIRAIASASQAITATSEAGANQLLFGSETFDANSDFASSTFTAPENGYYHVIASIPVNLSAGSSIFGSVVERVGVAIKISGITYYSQRPSINPSYAHEVHIFVHIDEIVQMNAGQTLGVYIWKDASSPFLPFGSGYVSSINIYRVK